MSFEYYVKRKKIELNSDFRLFKGLLVLGIEEYSRLIIFLVVEV